MGMMEVLLCLTGEKIVRHHQKGRQDVLKRRLSLAVIEEEY